MFDFEKYAPFVWGSYGLTVAVFAVLIWWAVSKDPTL